MSAPSLPARVKQYYERVSIDRDAALPDLAAIYSDDVHFINPVVNQRGLSAFAAAWRKALKMYAVFEFEDIVVAGTDEAFTLTYAMNIRFAVGPVFRTEMSTFCRGRQGKVVYCRDYFDPLGALVGPLPPLAWLYRVVFRRLVA